MFTKTIGWLVTPLWIMAMTWLVAHDIAPHWTASAPPPLQPGNWLSDGARTQFAISDEFGAMGWVWSEYFIDDRSLRRDDFVWLYRLPVDLAPLKITIESVFTAKGVLDEFTVRLEAIGAGGANALLHGERFHADFSFTLESGPLERSFKIPLVESGLVTGAFHPFGALTGLHVGQKWRMQVVNPVSILTGIGSQFIPLLVEVTGEERLGSGDQSINCFVVESPNARAWVDAQGMVRAQEITLPLLGRLRLDHQPDFDQEAYLAARSFAPARRGARP